MAKEMIMSPATGILSSRLFNDGDSVKIGDSVAVIECMKMQIPVDCMSGGVITYSATEGELVGMDDVIAEIQITNRS